MKIITTLFLLLAGLSTALADSAAPAPTASAPSSAASASPTVAIVPVPTATLQLVQKDNRLHAYVVVESPVQTESSVSIQWTAPAHSGCMSSTFPLTYRGKLYHTHAYRTVVFGLPSNKTRVCSGTWQVAVLDAQGNVLVSNTAVVTAPAPVAATTPAAAASAQ